MQKTLLTESQQKALDLSHHTAITANAGSGKTKVLTERFLEILKHDPNLSIKNIVAITFTKKAAAELYKKLNSAINDYTPDEYLDVKRLSLYRQELLGAKISTFHVFCSDILRKYPLELGIDANFSIIDTAQGIELFDKVATGILNNYIYHPKFTEDFKDLVRVLHGPRNLESAIRVLYNKRKTIIEFLSLHGSETDSDETLAAYFKSLYIKYSESVTELPPDMDLDFSISAYHTRRFLTLYNLIIEEYNRIKFEKSLLDFDDIILLTHELLTTQNNADTTNHKKSDIIEQIREELASEYKYIMIDEYQDTDEIQYELFASILNKLDAGNLFVVGDEKQSIYRFRDAEIEVFQKTKQDISDKSGNNYTLNESFRMAPQLTAFTNAVCRPFFGTPNPLYNEVQYDELVCAKTANFESEIEFLVNYAPEDEYENQNRVTASDLVATKILELKDEVFPKLNWDVKPSYSDIAILVKKNSIVEELEISLVKYGIPYVVIGGRNFFKQQFVKDISNYLTFLSNKDDDTSLMGILRSPFFTISDKKIFDISKENGITLYSKCLLYSEKDVEIMKVIGMLKENIALAGTFGIVKLIRKITLETPFLAVLATGINGKKNIANYEKFIRLSSEFLSVGFKTFYDFITFLKERMAGDDDTAQENDSDDRDAVQIMSIHKSKGLQWKAVFLYGLERKGLSNSLQANSIYVDKEFGIVSKLPYFSELKDKKSVDPKMFADFRKLSIGLKEYLESFSKLSETNHSPFTHKFEDVIKRKEAAEVKRLLYVAITRAENFLYFTYDEKKSTKSLFLLGDVLQYIGLELKTDLLHSLTETIKKYAVVNGEPATTEESINIEIRIREKDSFNLSKIAAPTNDDSATTQEQFKVCIEPIIAHPEGEVISASRFASFRFCPTRYRLSYVLKFENILKQSKSFKSLDKEEYEEGHSFAVKEKLESDLSIHRLRTPSEQSVRGIIVHRILQLNIRDESAIIDVCKDEINRAKLTDDSFNQSAFIENVIRLVTGYYNSNTFKIIASYERAYNEREIFLKENDFFLLGILDKLVLDGNKAIIIDYKTDTLTTEEEYIERSNEHFNQLKFYAYLISIIHKDIDDIELRLVYIKKPEVPYSTIVSKQDIAETESKIKEMIAAVRSNYYEKEVKHCPNCIFADDEKNCILKN